MNQATALLGLITETSLHAGAGSSVGAVDLPIQREGHNGWPCVFGSAVKGALRDRGETSLGAADDDLLALFGPDTKNASDHAGALAVGDARLLLLPVRSLTTAYKWVTCPEALTRLKRDADRLGLAGRCTFEVPSVSNDNEARVVSGATHLFLEEYRFTQTTEPPIGALIPVLAQMIARNDAADELSRRLVIVSNDMFSHLAHAATPVNAHIALHSDTKTVRDGALWYEETLPPETLLYVPLLAVAARSKGRQGMAAATVLKKATDLFVAHPWLQLGGNETVGMGWCGVRVLTVSE